MSAALRLVLDVALTWLMPLRAVRRQRDLESAFCYMCDIVVMQHKQHKQCEQESRRVAALEEVQAVAAAMLDQEGPDVICMCRQVAADAAARGDDELRDSFTQFAEEAEKLLQAE